MPRILKKTLYGIFFAALLGLAAFFVYKAFKPETEVVNPLCFDGIQNQAEEAIDCGGPCSACLTPGVELTVGGVRVIAAGDDSTFVVSLANPSGEYGSVYIPYELQIADRSGRVIERIDGVTTIYPSEDKYLVIPAVGIDASDLGEPVFAIGEIDFVEEDELPAESVAIADLATNFPEGRVEVSGSVVNDASNTIDKVRLTAVMFTPEGDLANASVTTVENIQAFGSKSFTIIAPRSQLFIDPTKTEIFWEVLN